MPGTLVPDQMYDHECNVIKGWWHPHAIDRSGPIAEGENFNAGSIVYLDVNAEFRAGLPENTVGYFAWPNSDDFDVDGDVGNIQSRVLMGLPVTACYDLYTTEFDQTFEYDVNDYLTAWDAQLMGFTPDKLGLVRPGVPYTNTLIGTVNAGVFTNEYKKTVLRLLTYHLPIAVAEGS